MSKIRKRYIVQLVFRCLVLVLCGALCLWFPRAFDVLEGARFFTEFSVLHILWVIWVVGMITQILPIKNRLPLGSMKLFANRFRPAGESPDREALRSYIRKATKAAYQVFALWCALIAVIGILYWCGVLGKKGLFLISVCFYVCDLICVLIWCPFRVMMKTRCCTTCRIFNWDHWMMFSPLIFMGGFFAISLVVLASAAWLIWELSILIHPERFWERTNTSLKCSQCTDKFCPLRFKKSKKATSAK